MRCVAKICKFPGTRVALTGFILQANLVFAAPPTWYFHADLAALHPVIQTAPLSVVDGNGGTVTYEHEKGQLLALGTGLSFFDVARLEVNIARSLKQDIQGHGAALIRSRNSNEAIITQLYLDFKRLLSPLTTRLDPYVFAGAGLNRSHMSGLKVLNASTGQEVGHYADRLDRTLVTRYGAGIAYHFNPRWALDIQYHDTHFGHAIAGPFVGGAAQSSTPPQIPLHYQGMQCNVRYYFDVRGDGR